MRDGDLISLYNIKSTTNLPPRLSSEFLLVFLIFLVVSLAVLVVLV